MDAKLLFVNALSPLHAGTGQGVGAIDLPIAREKATNLPYLPGSSLKGVLRAACGEDERVNIFGPDTNNAELHAGSVHFTDQRLLLFPVRSLRGTFAWVTAPFVLRRFLRDATNLAESKIFPTTIPDISEGNCLLEENSPLRGTDKRVTLEDIPLTPMKIETDDEELNPEENNWASALGNILFPDKNDPWRAMFSERFCIVSDEVFGFLVETATEVVARIAMDDEKKTVKDGALWYEESLPAESILSGLVVASPVKIANADAVFTTISTIIANPLQLGGNATVGRGLCCLRM